MVYHFHHIDGLNFRALINYMGVSIDGGIPNGWFIRKIPLKCGLFGGYPYFRKPPYVGNG